MNDESTSLGQTGGERTGHGHAHGGGEIAVHAHGGGEIAGHAHAGGEIARLGHGGGEAASHGHGGPDVYILTWVALLMLTAITVTVAGMHLGKLSVLTAIVIAAVKASVVLFFFMHLKYERRVFKTMVCVALGTLAIFIGLTFTDILFR